MFILFLIILVINVIYLFNHLDSLTIAQGYFFSICRNVLFLFTK